MGQSAIRVIRATALAALLLAMPAAASAQGCAMCAQNAAGAKAKGQRALNDGILLLITPTLGIFAGVFFLAYKRRNSP